MYGVKSKVGPVGISCVVVWLVLVYGAIWGQLEKSTPPFSFPPKVIGVLALFINKSERNCLLAVQSNFKPFTQFGCELANVANRAFLCANFSCPGQLNR